MLLADALLDALREALDVGDEQVVADELDAVAELVGQELAQPSQSSSARPSSMLTMGYLSTRAA